MKEIEAVIGWPIRTHKKAVQILLAIKQKKVAKGHYMPYGGKREQGETFEEAMIRELSQESRMLTEFSELEDVGILFVRYFRNEKLFQLWKIKMFLIHGWVGTPTDTDEMKDPRWCSFSNSHRHELPFEGIPEGDRLLTSRILSGMKLGLSIDCDIETMTLRRQPHIIFEVKRLSRPR